MTTAPNRPGTPFVNNIFFLRTYAPHWKLTNLINGLVLVFVFIGMRIVLGLPAGWRMFSELRGNYAAGTLSAASFVVMSAIIAILCALNVLWAFKLLKGFVAVASGGKVKGPANPYKKD